jgi:hypothetical protein
MNSIRKARKLRKAVIEDTAELVSSANPASPGLQVKYTARVTAQSNGTATGTIAFLDGSLIVATVPLAGNQAAYTKGYKQIGQHSITATYSGDSHNAGSKSAVLTETIRGGSKTVVMTSGSPSIVGQLVTFTATITSTWGAIPDGEPVTFYDGITVIGTSSTMGGIASFKTPSLPAKTHIIKVAYLGDGSLKPSSGTATQVVNKNQTITFLTSSLNPSRAAQIVTFTAPVTTGGPPPTGKVKFLDGTVAVGTVTLTQGIATLSKSKLLVGTHPMTAVYLGNAAFASSASEILNQVVQ